MEADVFVIYTDSETWAGEIHPVEALRRYREKTGIPAKLVVVVVGSNGFSIADANEAGMIVSGRSSLNCDSSRYRRREQLASEPCIR